MYKLFFFLELILSRLITNQYLITCIILIILDLYFSLDKHIILYNPVNLVKEIKI